MSATDFLSFLFALTSIDNDVTKNEKVRFAELTEEAQEIVRTASMRLNTRILSLDRAQRDYAKAEQDFMGALVEFAEDPDDSFETASHKASVSTLIDHAYDQALTRLNFEMRDSNKISIVP